MESNAQQNYSFHILQVGYSELLEGGKELKANCTCTLIKGPNNVIVDTMTSWDKEKVEHGLKENGLSPDDIDYVISTHGHSDHIGNNNLFLKAKHIVGFSISFKDIYYLQPSFELGEELIIDANLKVIPTPGHTLSDVTVILKTLQYGTVAIAGDLFECAEDITEPSKWLEAGSEAHILQRSHRARVAEMADWIVPGHGDKFQVITSIRNVLKSQVIAEEKNL